ncbi:hypothetical protein EES44_15820 [Streptomyces sp. ADI96-15]|nr:hypothetical protein EES44_15820 [Streptomyces sp. ADI96-15]
MGGLRGAPKRVELIPRVTDPEAGRRLWSASEELTGMRYAFQGVR